MASVDIFPMYECFWLKRILDPKSVFHVSDRVVNSCEYGDRNLRNGLDRKEVSLTLATDQISIVVCIDLEPVFFHVLCIKLDVFCRGSIRHMSCVYLESVVIVQVSLVSQEEGLHDFTYLGDVSAKQIHRTC